MPGDPITSSGFGLPLAAPTLAPRVDGAGVTDTSVGAVVGTVNVGVGPLALAYASGSGHVYVANSYSNNLTVINGATGLVVGSIPAGFSPEGVAYDSANGCVYVTDAGANSVLVINDSTGAAIGSIPVGSGPGAIAYDGANGYLYVTEFDSSSVVVINGTTNAVVGSIPVGSWPTDLAYDSANGYVYVANDNSSNVSVVDGATDSDVGSIAVGPSPYGVAYDSGNGYVYVTLYGANRTTAIDGATDTVVGSAPVGPYPHGLAYDSANGYVYVTGSDVTVINGTTVTVAGVVPVGAAPLAVTYDATNGCLYVANYFADTVSIINPAATFYAVTFSESGLPAKVLAHAGWTAQLGDTALRSNSSSITFLEPNGTYPYFILGPSGRPMQGLAPAGSVTVSGANVTDSFVFAKGKTVDLTFKANGLPGWQSWCLDFNGWTFCGWFPQGLQNLTPGSYALAVVSPTAGQVITAKLGKTAIGLPAVLDLVRSSTVTLTFSYQYTVTFTETGLASGSWSVKVRGFTLSNATGDPIIFHLTNGTYGYKIAKEQGFSASGAPTRVTVAGSEASVQVTFTRK